MHTNSDNQLRSACFRPTSKSRSLDLKKWTGLFFKSLMFPLAFFYVFNSSLAQASQANDHHKDSHVDEFMQAMKEQKDYFQSLKKDLEEGRPIDVASGSCKYISSLFRPAPDRVVSFTFDDGPSAALTPKLLNILKKYQIKATFFVLGENAQDNLGVIRRAQNEGHLIASHSWNHPNFHTLSEEKQRQQISRTDEIIRSYMHPVKLFRYPYGNSTCSSNAFIKSLGYSGIVGWHIDSCDWAYADSGHVTNEQAKICEVAAANKANYVGHVLSEVNRNHGGVILMHDVHEKTVASVEEIIIRLKKAGYSFANLDDGLMTQFYGP